MGKWWAKKYTRSIISRTTPLVIWYFSNQCNLHMFLVKISNVEGGPFQLSNAIEKCFETKQKFIILNKNKKKFMLKISKRMAFDSRL